MGAGPQPAFDKPFLIIPETRVPELSHDLIPAESRGRLGQEIESGMRDQFDNTHMNYYYRHPTTCGIEWAFPLEADSGCIERRGEERTNQKPIIIRWFVFLTLAIDSAESESVG